METPAHYHVWTAGLGGRGLMMMAAKLPATEIKRQRLRGSRRTRAPLVADPACGPPRHGGGRPPRPRLAVRSRRSLPRTRPRPLELI